MKIKESQLRQIIKETLKEYYNDYDSEETDYNNLMDDYYNHKYEPDYQYAVTLNNVNGKTAHPFKQYYFYSKNEALNFARKIVSNSKTKILAECFAYVQNYNDEDNDNVMNTRIINNEKIHWITPDYNNNKIWYYTISNTNDILNIKQIDEVI